MSEIGKHIAVSAKVEVEDLDWELARRHGLTDHEVECLGYFADVESQTAYYFLEVAKLQIAREPEFLTFLTMWNYEEFFHSHAITRLMEECGVKVEAAMDRATEVRSGARLKARIEDVVQSSLATIAPNTFMALWTMWGSTQELLTTQAYEQIAATTANPVCATLCKRIAKQERRHFAYYHNRAREYLKGRPVTQRIVRKVVESLWTPVGNGVKTPQAAAELAQRLFPGPRFAEVLGVIDRRAGALPGMEGISACSDWARRMNLWVEAARESELAAEDARAATWAASA